MKLFRDFRGEEVESIHLLLRNFPSNFQSVKTNYKRSSTLQPSSTCIPERWSVLQSTQPMLCLMLSTHDGTAKYCLPLGQWQRVQRSSIHRSIETVGTSPGQPRLQGSTLKATGIPNRFKIQLVYTIYQTIYAYNHTRIHSAKKPPRFALQAALP